MNYEKLVAMKISALHAKDQRWLLKQLPPQQRHRTLNLMKEFSKIGKGQIQVICDYFQTWLDKEQLLKEQAQDHLERLSSEISRWSALDAKSVILQLPKSLQMTLQQQEQWQWLESSDDEKLILLNNMPHNPSSLVLSKKMREVLLDVIHSSKTKFVEQ